MILIILIFKHEIELGGKWYLWTQYIVMKPKMVVNQWPRQSPWRDNVPCKDERERHQSGVS